MLRWRSLWRRRQRQGQARQHAVAPDRCAVGALSQDAALLGGCRRLGGRHARQGGDVELLHCSQRSCPCCATAAIAAAPVAQGRDAKPGCCSSSGSCDGCGRCQSAGSWRPSQRSDVEAHGSSCQLLQRRLLLLHMLLGAETGARCPQPLLLELLLHWGHFTHGCCRGCCCCAGASIARRHARQRSDGWHLGCSGGAAERRDLSQPTAASACCCGWRRLCGEGLHADAPGLQRGGCRCSCCCCCLCLRGRGGA